MHPNTFLPSFFPNGFETNYQACKKSMYPLAIPYFLKAEQIETIPK